MVDWTEEEELSRDAAAFQNLIHALLGVYLWEWATTLGFEWQYLSGKKRFRWPLIFYFADRYCLLFAMIGVVISFNIKTKIDCQSLYTFNSLMGNAAVGFASINLSLRTLVVWQRRWYIVVPLVVVIIGHWSLLCHGILLRAIFVPGIGCVITKTNNTILAAAFIYTMCFDFFVLVLTAYKLLDSVQPGRSRVVSMLFHDGLVYFCIAVLANTIATAFMLVNLNAVMSIIFNIPSAMASTIVACRAVRRLNSHVPPGPLGPRRAPSQGGSPFFTTLRISSLFADSQRATTAPVSLDTIQSSLASRGSVPSPDIPDLPDRHIKESARTSQTAYADELSEADITKSVLADERSEHDIDLEARQHGVDVMPKWPPR